MNKDFHSRMNFNSNISNYNLTRERIKAEKINDIVNQMQKLLKFDQKHIKKINQQCESRLTNIAKKWSIKSMILLNSRRKTSKQQDF